MNTSNFDSELSYRLEALRAQRLYRELRRVDSPASTKIEINGCSLLNFSSNDYLGLANHPSLKEAAMCAVERYGAGSGSSRLICGSLTPHHQLEETLANFKRTEAAISFSSGYAAAVGTICALLSKDDIIILDKLVHACIVDAARLSGAKLRVFDHNDLNDLEKILRWADSRERDAGKKRPHVMIVTESVFSMDGDFAPLFEMVKLKEKYGAWLMVDEAHATGLLGSKGRGLADEAGVTEQIEIQMGTLGKAFGASGGFIAGSRPLIDYLINRARTFIFSTAPAPAASAAARAGVELAAASEGGERRIKLFSSVARLKKNLQDSGWTVADNRSPIIPLLIGDETDALNAAASLRAHGLFIPAIRYPTVARRTARLRVTLTAAHGPDEVASLESELTAIRQAQPAIRHA